MERFLLYSKNPSTIWLKAVYRNNWHADSSADIKQMDNIWRVTSKYSIFTRLKCQDPNPWRNIHCSVHTYICKFTTLTLFSELGGHCASKGTGLRWQISMVQDYADNIFSEYLRFITCSRGTDRFVWQMVKNLLIEFLQILLQIISLDSGY